MDVVESVQACVQNWETGGESECRDILNAPHCNPSDPNSNDVLSTAYHTLITSTLQTWSPTKALSPQSLTDFIQSVLERLPSPSSAKSSNAVVFGELLVDLIWSIDVDIDEVYQDAKLALANAEQGKTPVVAEGSDPAEVLAKVAQAKKNAEVDKETLGNFVRQLVSLGVLDSNVCRERLELPMISQAGLVLDDHAFGKKEVRARTALFYKQNKFNLLREQSEGYSKLTTELTSRIGPPHSPATGIPVESFSAIEARAKPAWERIVGLVGYFDLDPNRALDIILDVFSVHLMTHYAFFLSLLSFSPWASSPPKTTDTMSMDSLSDPEIYRGRILDDILRLAELQNGKAPRVPQSPASMGANHCRVLAQVLGFKFVYYQALDVPEQTPKNLYLTAALLIREGFITLEDIYPHITPTDGEMEDNLHKQYLASVASRISGAKVSLLAMAAPLESSSSSNIKTQQTTPAETKSTKPEVKEVPNQKLGLLNALLALGALRPALTMLSKFPWMVDAFPEIADLMLRILKHSIAPVYESYQPEGLYQFRGDVSSFATPRSRYGPSGVTPPSERKPYLTLWAPTPPPTSAADFVFFFPQWTDRIPVCKSIEDIKDVLEPLMRFVGIMVHRDLAFFTRFVRLGRSQLSTVCPDGKKVNGDADPEHPIRRFWFKAARRYMLPSLPLIRGNAVTTVEVWNVLRCYDVTERWRLYGEWRSCYKSHPELRVREVQVDRESKGILRRLSLNTIDSLSGAVAKLAHSNPCIFFSNAVYQIMAYDNLAPVVVQAMKSATLMGFDVMMYAALDALANPNKNRVKDDGVNSSDWLLSLSSFIGLLFTRYSVDLTPILQYIVHQLHNGQTTEIVVLRELIWKMAGIEPLPSLSDSQIAAMGGGPTLRAEAIASSSRGSRSEPGQNKNAPKRLGDALLESQLALPLLIQVAQQRQACVFQAPNAHLKSLASLYDTTHGVLLQYLELLTSPSIVPAQIYAEKVLPSLIELNKAYGICPPICMQIVRPKLHLLLLTAALNMQEKERVASEEAEKRLKAALTAKREPGTTTTSRVGSPAVLDSAASAEQINETSGTAQANQSTEDISMEGTELSPVPVPAPAPPENPWLTELYSLFDEVKEIAPGNAADVLGPGFYLTFWQLSTYELSPPTAKYEEESNNLRALYRQEDALYNAADRSSDRIKRATTESHRLKRNRYTDFVNHLSHEMKDQTAVRSFTIKRLAREKHHWFAHGPKALTLASSFIEHCLLPRAVLSPMDADYCAQVIKVIHLLGTPGFSTLRTYDKLLAEDLGVVVFSCSEYEARNYGRFLLGVLTDLWKWHQDEALFMQDNRVKSGGKVTYLPGFLWRFSNKPAVAIGDIISWDQFRTVFKKWHRKIVKCFVECIETGEFMHVYNTIIVLKEILPVFPLAAVNETSGATLDAAIDRFVEKEERGDLKILGRAYAASLKKREPMWAPPAKIAKSIPSAPSAKSSPVPPQVPDKPRSTIPPSAPNSSVTTDARRTNITLPASTPSAPRAHVNGSGPPSGTQASSTQSPASMKAAIESIPRPEVVKRIRPDNRSPVAKVNGDSESGVNGKADAMNVDTPVKPRKDEPATPRGPSGVANGGRPSSPSLPSGILPPIPRSISQQFGEVSRPNTPGQLSVPRAVPGKDLPGSPRVNNGEPRGARFEASQAMPPPTNPSQTTSAQELRETAKQSRPSDKVEERTRPVSDSRGLPAPPTAPSPSSRRRSPSPSSRPGTRNPSVESRASGGRSRATTNEAERPEEKRSDRDSRHEAREPRGRDGHGRAERSGRANRDNDREKDGDRDRDRGRDSRDRHGDRERGRDRDRGERERDRDREKDRDPRDRDRDHRDRERGDRDRHRRDDKDRDRESRKERESTNRSAAASATATPIVDDRGLPSRPDASRRREEDSLGKRRRPTEDDSDRASKRPSRKESHHEDRSRRLPEKDSHDRPRDSDRRRKDREPSENDSRTLSIDTKLADKRIPDGPASARALPPSTPSAPRAMSSNDTSRQKSDREWRGRDQPLRTSPTGPSAVATQSPQEHISSGGSLRSRIGDKEPSRSLPDAPSGYRTETSDRGKPEGSKDEGRDGSRKRASSERDNADLMQGLGDGGSLASKRPKINRNRYNGSGGMHGLAKKLLPIDADKTRSGRKD